MKHVTGNIYFGPSVEGKSEGNAGNCPAFSPDLFDQDECYQDGDAGLIWPEAHTITGPSGSERVVPCSGTGAIIDTACQIVFWGSQIDIEVTGPGYVNILMDWNQDGQWALDPESICPVGGLIPEHVLADFPVGIVSHVPLSTLSPPPFRLGPANGFIWCRFTISEQPVGDNNWNGAGNFMNGETEDYLLEVYTSGVIISETEPPVAGMPVRVIPNPATERVTVEFTPLKATW